MHLSVLCNVLTPHPNGRINAISVSPSLPPPSDPDKPEKLKKSKSSKKKRRHSDEAHSDGEEGHHHHRPHKAAKKTRVELPTSARDVPETLANVVEPRAAAVGKRVRQSSSGSNEPHIVTNKSNGQSKLLTNPKSSKLGGIPTDPSKLVEILTKSLDPHAAPEPATEILSSDSERNDR